eukprot:CAMPEP_0197029000 /NCGR_PEP_ID=MMETSP1384-20130603/8548_1 /TAXON_ID=29189 /ORGANISM="Ammonia sp." /LENGTH=452 /DNA_ID=CAMNT_0042458091 /DNA_START=56 /DNA_END=1414 /DNA_ORIENTATION=+
MGASQSHKKNDSSPNVNDSWIPMLVHAKSSHSELLEEKLPGDLKEYSNSIEILSKFWYSEIESLDEIAYQDTAVLFYANASKRLPALRNLIKKDVELHSQAKQYFGMFRWLITNLRMADPQQLITQIRMLGELHKKLNVLPEWYPLMLQALHETLTDRVKEKYTPRARFCMEQLYTVAANIMLGRDFDSLSSAKIAHFIQSLNNLEDCLNDEEGIQYLELYMSQQFCVELILFYKDCRAFQMHFACLSEQQRMGQEIMTKYFDSTAECEINISYSAKETVKEKLNKHQNVFAADIFDECLQEVTDLIRTNIWHGFRGSIQKMAVHDDVYFEEIQSWKARAASIIAAQSASPTPVSEAASPDALLSISSDDSNSNSNSNSSATSTESTTASSAVTDHVLPSAPNSFTLPNSYRPRVHSTSRHSRHEASIEESVTSSYELEKYMVHEDEPTRKQ